MIKPDSMKYQVLEMVGISGEFPVKQLHRLIESSSYAEKIITELKNEKLIRTHYRDRLRGYRLTKHAKELCSHKICPVSMTILLEIQKQI